MSPSNNPDRSNEDELEAEALILDDPSKPGNPQDLIASLALDGALTASAINRLKAGNALALVVQAPSSAWCEPLRRALRARVDHRLSVIASNGDARKATQQPDTSELIAALAQGRVAGAVAPMPDRCLNPVLLAAADLTVVVPAASPELMSEAIVRWCDSHQPVELTFADLSGLDLPDLAAALRPGAAPSECVTRLRRAADRRRSTGDREAPPHPAQLQGYGAAGEWATKLIDDIARVRAGLLDSRELESAVFVGAPGTGKTFLVRAFSSASGLDCRETSVSRWFASGPGYLDSVIKQLDLFCDALLGSAAAQGVAIGFIDELDALPSRANVGSRNADWWGPVITHALLRVEELRKNGVVLLAATNHIDHVDEALLRPGRIDRRFEILPPDEVALAGILRHHLGSDLPGADLLMVARLGAGATGAKVGAWVRGARARARGAGRALTLQDLLDEIAPLDGRSPEELQATAIHEAAHAVVALRLGLAVDRVSILMRATSSGETVVRLSDAAPSRVAVEAQIVGLLAGRAGDVVLGRGPTSGAMSDLQAATRLAAAIHATFGLGATLSHRGRYEEAEAMLLRDPALARTVEADLQRLMNDAVRLVEADREVIRYVSARLVERRVLAGAEVEGMLAGRSRPDAKHVAVAILPA